MITLDKAIEQAEKFTEGATFHAGSEGWKAVMARLLEEVKRKNPPVDPAKGCWMDDGQGSLPDTCVIDDGKPENCVYARGLTTHGECKYWKEPACQIAEETNDTMDKEAWIIEALHTLQHGVQIMTVDQVSQWDGVRALVELCPVDASPRDYDAFPVVEEPNEIKGPLPAAILADMIDHQADELEELAMEIDIFSIWPHAEELRGAAKQMVQWAKQIREDANK